ncbi:MAG: DUF721 domain-containing protein [Bacteroidetes bacterium]|nr:DUF721 domain-containing protein [Bacteroidota bacterium]
MAGKSRVGKLASIQDLIHFYKNHTTAGKIVKKFDVLAEWPSIVGERIAQETTAEKIENKILKISVKNSSWRQELTFRKTEILTKINTHFGEEIVKDILFR